MVTMKNVIHIFGASGSGTSTLGKYISDQLDFDFLEADQYYWIRTNPRFIVRREEKSRIEHIQNDINASENVVLAGAIEGWGDELIPQFTLAIRLVTDTKERLRRITEREHERFGDRILFGGDMYERHQAFIRWTSKYDNGGLNVRSKASHDEWQKKLGCKVLTLSGSDSVEDNFEIIRKELSV